jgi:hypothetical protein
VSFESLLAGQAAKVKSFPTIGYFEFGCLVIHNCAANRIFGHFTFLNLMVECSLYLLLIVVKKKEKDF